MKPSDITTLLGDLLSQIEEFKYIDRNWGQLELEQPAVKFPCAITDVDNIQYADLLQKAQLAECEFTITIAVQNFHNTSQKSPCKDKGHDIFDLIDKVHEILQGYSTEALTPFCRRRLQKIEAEKGYSIYQLTYITATRTQILPKYQTAKPKPIIECKVKSVKLKV
ncbi:MAG: hypothetical protein MJZ66_05840 [Bacteroidales bacterium]|nr:hypothetical protein [Bacteroidales bacterium]